VGSEASPAWVRTGSSGRILAGPQLPSHALMLPTENKIGMPLSPGHLPRRDS